MWRYKTKCISEIQSQLWSNFKIILVEIDLKKKNIASASNYELKFEPWYTLRSPCTTTLSNSMKIKICEVERHFFVIDQSGSV